VDKYLSRLLFKLRDGFEHVLNLIVAELLFAGKFLDLSLIFLDHSDFIVEATIHLCNMHVLVLLPDFIFFIKFVRFLTGCLPLLALLRFDDFIEGAVLSDGKVLKDSALVLIIMNQRSYQVECSIHNHQRATGLPIL
jgi:hypothetical protein